MTRVAMIGLGQMGMPMLERQRAAGFEVGFWARQPEAIDRAVRAGAAPVGALDGCALVTVCVRTDDQVRQVGTEAIATMSPGATLVVHTTVSPVTIGYLTGLAEVQGVDVLDAALSGSPDDVASGVLTLLIGGDEPVLERARPALASYASSIIRVGDLGDGQRVKLLNNLLLGAQTELVVEAERVATSLGLDASVALDAIQHCSGDSRALRYAIGIGSAARLEELAGPYIRKDVAVAETSAAELGVDLGPLARDRHRLADREAIKELKARYFRFIDTKDWSSLRTLFTEDCRHHLPQESPVPFMDNDSYFAMMETMLTPGITTHHGLMPEITFTSATEADGIWAMSDYVQVDPPSGRVSLKGWGYYFESYRKGDDGTWRISAKRNERLRLDEVPWTLPEVSA